MTNRPIPRKGTSTYGAWRKGRDAAELGLDKDACPYTATSYTLKCFRHYWMDGWKAIKNNLQTTNT